MNIDDMGDNPRVPDQPSACHYWPDCTCGPHSKCWLQVADDSERLHGIALMIVLAAAMVFICMAAGVGLALYAALTKFL
ncbi:hypothetical protein [Sulfitobacter sp. M22]|uniref:hypothetical protein n=1 Tax=Sulfitobacter sp. M22 TaxID=2675332 RepID=UPI001F28A9CA|nr:hypothetical protein [Sulfitobacter sp. M22]MCF7725749.1 hypothetical protein [Sulfitobacter sp. M22]